LDKLKREQSLIDPENITELEMDRYASNFFVTRDQGSRPTGFVRIYFRTPRTLYINPGTYFETADGKRFNINAAYSITEAQMALNISEYPNSATGLIAVTGVNHGSANETGANTITKVVGLGVDYAYVKNPLAITGGTSRETNTQLKSRIESSTINQSISSDRGIQSIIMNNFTTISDVVVKGANDIEMKRDLVYTVSGGEVLSNLPSNFYRSDYFGALSGIQTPPANRSRGYWGVFYVEVPAGSGIQPADIPGPDNFTDEWTTQRYTRLYKVDDALYQTISTDSIMTETFAAGVADNETWVMSDGSTIDGRLLATDEIEIVDSSIRLGKARSTTVDGWITLDPNSVSALKNLIGTIQDASPNPKETERD